MKALLSVATIMLLSGAASAAPGLVQYASSGMERNNSGTYTIHLPQPAQAGNLLVICLAADASATWSVPSDDKSGTWTAGPTLSTNQTVSMFYSQNAKGGASLLTAPCIGGICGQAGHMQVAEFNNVAITSAIDTSGSNNASTASQSVSLTTATDGDLVLICGNDTSLPPPNVTTMVANGNGIPMVADFVGGNWMGYEVQTTHGTISPGFTQSGTDNWTKVAAAFKPALAGSPATAGMSIKSIQHFPYGSTVHTNKFPTVGNLFVCLFNSGDVHLSGLADSNSNSWSRILSDQQLADGGAIGDFWYAPNATPSVNLVLTLTYSGTSIGTNHLVCYDIVGALTPDPLDVKSSSTGDQVTTGDNAVDSITPTTTDGIAIAHFPISFHTMTAISGGWSSDIFLNSTDDNNGGVGGPLCFNTAPSEFDEDNGYGHLHYHSTATTQVVWLNSDPGNCGKHGVGSWDSQVAAFKAAQFLPIMPPNNSTSRIRLSSSGHH